jgi:hypothetical protein|tara:strand:+ start:320 stop:1192 length:873 start_codon:yes stop_codon:yes gene_type:complete
VNKIIWIASYPKSGNTMMRLFLSSYFYTENGILEDFSILKNIPAFNHMKLFQEIENFPSVDHFVQNPESISLFWQIAQKNINKKKDKKILFLKTHNAQINFKSFNFTEKDLTRAFIYVVRDPRSVLLSSFSHYGHEDYNETLKVIMSDQRYSYAVKSNNRLPEFLLSWRSNFISWHNFGQKNQDLGLIVKYEDMVLNPETTFLKVLTFLEKKIKVKFNNDKFQNSIRSINFKHIQQIENKIGFFERSKNSKKFFRSGKINEWQKKLNSETIKIIKKKLKKEMNYLGYYEE